MHSLQNYCCILLLLLSFNVNLGSQTNAYKRPGLSLQFTATEFTGTYHFPVNYHQFNPEIQYKVNNERLEAYRSNLKNIIVITQDSIYPNLKRNAGLFLEEALTNELAKWESLQKAKKRHLKLKILKCYEKSELNNLKSSSIYILTYDDLKANKNAKELLDILTYNELDTSALNSPDVDNYCIKYIDECILIIGSNPRSTIYGASELISKLDQFKFKEKKDMYTIEELETDPLIIDTLRLANLWNGINLKESKVSLSSSNLFSNVFEASRDNSAKLIYEKLAKMLAYYHLNGIVINGYDDFYTGKYNGMIKMFTKIMNEFGIDTYVEVSADYAERKGKLVESFFNQHNEIKGLVITTLNPYQTVQSGGTQLANSIVRKDFKVVWRDQIGKPITNGTQMDTISQAPSHDANFSSQKLDQRIHLETIIKIDEQKPFQNDESKTVVDEEADVNSYKFSPASFVDGVLIKSYVLHWKGSNPKENYLFPDEKSDVAFMIYFYTKESQHITRLIDKKINRISINNEY